jgi:Zn-dependent M16 (insulinase) family peptidase
MLNNYELVLKSKYLGKIPVEVYKSRRTGLHVAFADVAGPIVSSHLVLITETETDDGLPHTLEHLVFMGSKTYPFKGALDLLAMKAFSVGGTNAWTEQDHTSYTVKTIGESGMQQFIAVYGDHLINPILSDENYRSEVYNVTATGEETGVVYSEIQDNENNLDNLVSYY